MTDGVRELFDEYTTRFHGGEHPDPVAYLDRAGSGHDELRDLIDEFLREAPAPTPTPEMVAAMASWMQGESPVLELRKSRGAKTADVVDVLVAELGLDESRRQKVARYYQRLENGLLDLARVDARVFSALAKALGVRVSDLMFPRRPAATTASAYLRSSDEAEEVFEVLLASRSAVEERDEVDELFDGEQR